MESPSRSSGLSPVPPYVKMRFHNHILSARTSQLRCCSGFHICRTDFYFHNFSRHASILCCEAQPDKQYHRHLRNNAPTYPESFPGTALLHVRGHRLRRQSCLYYVPQYTADDFPVMYSGYCNSFCQSSFALFLLSQHINPRPQYLGDFHSHQSCIFQNRNGFI